MAPSQNQIVINEDRGDTTINVRELLDQPWYKYPHLRRLYLWLSVVLVVQATNGKHFLEIANTGPDGSNTFL